jgi:hypothetical protein
MGATWKQQWSPTRDIRLGLDERLVFRIGPKEVIRWRQYKINCIVSDKRIESILIGEFLENHDAPSAGFRFVCHGDITDSLQTIKD